MLSRLLSGSHPILFTLVAMFFTVAAVKQSTRAVPAVARWFRRVGDDDFDAVYHGFSALLASAGVLLLGFIAFVCARAALRRSRLLPADRSE